MVNLQSSTASRKLVNLQSSTAIRKLVNLQFSTVSRKLVNLQFSTVSRKLVNLQSSTVSRKLVNLQSSTVSRKLILTLFLSVDRGTPNICAALRVPTVPDLIASTAALSSLSVYERFKELSFFFLEKKFA